MSVEFTGAPYRHWLYSTYQREELTGNFDPIGSRYSAVAVSRTENNGPGPGFPKWGKNKTRSLRSSPPLPQKGKAMAMNEEEKRDTARREDARAASVCSKNKGTREEDRSGRRWIAGRVWGWKETRDGWGKNDAVAVTGISWRKASFKMRQRHAATWWSGWKGSPFSSFLYISLFLAHSPLLAEASVKRKFNLCKFIMRESTLRFTCENQLPRFIVAWSGTVRRAGSHFFLLGKWMTGKKRCVCVCVWKKSVRAAAWRPSLKLVRRVIAKMRLTAWSVHDHVNGIRLTLDWSRIHLGSLGPFSLIFACSVKKKRCSAKAARGNARAYEIYSWQLTLFSRFYIDLISRSNSRWSRELAAIVIAFAKFPCNG